MGRSLKYSFAFAGEDKVIEGLIKPLITKGGYYVDVGCNHPKFLSNTYGLYRKGWNGLCIDANKELIEKYKYFRPRDVAICALISNSTQERTFYKVQNNVLSTTEEIYLPSFREEGLQIEPIQLKPFTLTQILEKEKTPKFFDVLCIDTEDHDVQVLLSLDLDKFSPRLILFEDESFDPIYPEKNGAYRYLNEKDYLFKGFILKNLYFMRDDKGGQSKMNVQLVAGKPC